MRQLASDLEAFYATRLGKAAAARIGERLSDLWGPCQGLSVLGIGFPQPILPIWQASARTCVGVVTEEDLVTTRSFSGHRGGQIAPALDHRLPFGDGVFDRVVLLHALEDADSPRATLREAWRVLAPEGRIVVATANRKSFWSLAESKAFGHGRPWTRRQLIGLLNDGLFQVTASTTAVHMPPLNWPMITAASESWERVGELVTPGLGGAVLVEAVKHIYANPRGSAPATATQAAPISSKRPILPRKEAEPKLGDAARERPLTKVSECLSL
ncbi:MAG: methyltransferase domain-containing protein [Pseudomonadota bacterium]